MTSNLLLNKLMKRITKSSSDSKDTDKSGEDAVSLRKPSKKFLQYVSSSKHVSKTKSKSHRKKTTPREKSTTTVTPSTAEQKPVGAENKEEIESRLMSVASQGGIAGEMASSALEEGVEKEREQYGELATQEYQAKRTQSALRRSLSSLASSFSKNVRASREIEKDITQSYEKAAGSIEENIEYIKKHGTGNWYEYNGQRYRGSDLIKILQSEKEELEQEKEEKLKELTEYRRSNVRSFLGKSASIVGKLSSISSYLDKIKSLKESGAYAIRGEGGELVIFPSKKSYKKWKFFEKEKKEWEVLEQKASKGDILASLQLTGKKLLAGFGSFEGLSYGIKSYFSGISPYRAAASKAFGTRLTGWEEKSLTKMGIGLKKTYSKLSWKWSHSDIWSKAGMVLESPGGILASSLAGGYGAGLGVGALSRIAPTAGKITKVGLAGAGILATGTAAYDVGRTAIVEKDISKALGKGLVYGISFYGAGKLFKSGYTKGFKKAHVWWMSRHEPKFSQIIIEKTPLKGGKIGFKGFQEWSYKYSIGRRIHSTVYFEGEFLPEKAPRFRLTRAAYLELPEGRGLVIEGVMPEGESITFSKGVGRMEYGIFRHKSKIFEIIPEVSRGKSGRIFRMEMFFGKKGGYGFVSSHRETKFFSKSLLPSEKEVSWGKVVFGKTEPLRLFEMKFKGVTIYAESTKYIQTKAWMRGFTATEKFTLPTGGSGKIFEPKGFTYRGGEKPSFLVPIRGKPTGKVPLSSLYKTEQLTKIIPPRPPLETGELPPEFKTPLIPILVSKKISIKPFSALKTEPKAYELKGLPKISTKGGALLLLPPKLETKTVQKQKLKVKLIQRQKLRQLQLEKLKLEMENLNKILNKMRLESLSLKKTKFLSSLERSTTSILKTRQLQGQKLRLMQIIVQKPIILSKLKLRSLNITIPSLKLKSITATKTKLTEISAIPISPPPVGKPKLGFPGTKVSLIVKRRKKRRKTKRRKWKKTLLASPFLVEESYIKYGKATHPKPTKKLWKVGYRTMFKIPTVELMKKGKKDRRKKGGRKR